MQSIVVQDEAWRMSPMSFSSFFHLFAVICLLVLLGCWNAQDAEVLTTSEGEDGTERTCHTGELDSTFGPRQTSQVRYCNIEDILEI